MTRITDALFTVKYRSLWKNGNWTSSKTGLAYGVNGAASFMVSSIPLKEGGIDLSTWGGMQEIVSQKAFLPKKISFKFKLGDKTFLVFEYNRVQNEFEGIRFSTSENFTSKYIAATTDGNFTAQQDLKMDLNHDWNQVEVLFEPNSTIVILNSKPIFIGKSASVQQKIGFRGSVNTALVGSVKVEEADGSVWQEQFNNSNSFGWSSICILLVAVLTISAILIFYAQESGKYPRILSTLLVLNICLGTILIVNKYYFSYLYPDSPMQFQSLLEDIAVAAYPNKIRSDEEVEADIKKSYFENSSSDKFRIVFFGSSQTSGSGARAGEDAITKRFLAALDQGKLRGKIEVFNDAISGAQAEERFRAYAKYNSDLPNMVILNFSNNDSNTAALENGLRSFLDYNQLHKVRSALVEEANFIDQTVSQLAPNHLLIEKLSREYGVPYVDLHKHLLDLHDSGFLFWDYVHLTSYGQKLAGEYIAEKLLPIIKQGTLLKTEEN